MNNKDAYKDIFQGWMAKAAEYKMAIGIAVACTIIILVSLVWPKPKPEQTINGVNTTPPASHVYTNPAPAPTPAPTAQPATPPPAPAPSPMEKELAAKPLFPPAPKPAPAPAPKQVAPAPKPQAVPAPKPAATPAPSNTASALPAGWYVQVGSFKDKQHATALADKIENKHWQSRIAPRPGGLHAVWVGPYPTRDDAEKAKLALKKDTGLSGFPVQSP